MPGFSAGTGRSRAFWDCRDRHGLDRELNTALLATPGQNLPAVCRFHARAETKFTLPFFLVRLK
jgi:hypothetical protein